MATNETLDATYKVWYFGDPPHFIPRDDKLHKMNYTQVINVATLWMKDDREIEIRDGSSPIVHVAPKGVELITFDPYHSHFQEHLKIKIALDNVWGEFMSKYL